MITQIVLSVAVLAQVGDLQPTGDSVMTDTLYWSNGRLREIRTYSVGVFNYTFISWHANGELHRMGHHEDVDTRVDSSWDWKGQPLVVAGKGPYVEYFEDGTLSAQGFYRDAWKDSTWSTFHDNKQRSSRGDYQEDLSRARKEGEWTYWYANGKVHSKGVYKFDFGKGPWTFYHPNGRLMYTLDGNDFMNRGRYEDAYDSSGVKTLDQGHGFLPEYDQLGHRRALIQVRDFHKDTVMSFYPSGGRRDRMIYMTDSTRNVWWNEGTLLDAWDSTGLQTLNGGSGFQWTASDDGETRSRIRYAAGLKHGDSEQYDHRGRLRQLDCYDHGDWTGRVIYFNNGKRFTDFDCFNAPWLWQDEEIYWWYNGRLRRYDNGDSIVEY